MKKLIAGVLAGLVLAGGAVFAQNVRDSDNLIMRAFDPYVRYQGTLSLQNAAGTAVASFTQSAASITGQLSSYKPVSVTSSGLTTLVAADSGRVLIGTKSTGTQSFQLPSAATAGLNYCFIAGHADGDILIDPITAQDIKGKAHGAENGGGLDSASGRGIMNTAGTNVIGDLTCLVADGTSTWYMTSVAGVWAIQN